MLGKLFVSIVFLIVSRCVCIGQATVSFFAGPQLSTAQYLVQNFRQSTDFKFGFRAGVGMKVNFENNLYFFPALSFSKTGYKATFNRLSFPPDSSAKNNDASISQADVDLHLQYDIGDEPNHIYFKAGPTFNFTITGKEKFRVTTGETVSRTMKFGLYESYSRVMVAFSSMIGYEAESGFYIHLRYDHGLTSMNNADNGPQIYQRVFGVNVGLLLHH